MTKMKYKISDRKKKIKNYDKFIVKYKIVDEENPYSKYIKNNFKIKKK